MEAELLIQYLNIDEYQVRHQTGFFVDLYFIKCIFQ